MISECDASITTSKETTEAIKKLSFTEKLEFNGCFGSKMGLNSCYQRLNNLRYALLETALNDRFKDYRDELMKCTYEYSLLGLIDSKSVDILPLYLNPQYKFNINYYFERNLIFDLDRETYSVYDGNHSRLNHKYFTPLQLAVAQNKIEVVKLLVGASLHHKLQLDMAHSQRWFVNARSIARKIRNPSDRKAMLEVLKIDKGKHELYRVNFRLKDELDINVKEAVIANNILMVESALFLGNFGDKTDVNIIRRAMINENYLILEMLVMEGYAIPAKSNRPSYTKMNREDAEFILNQQGKIYPLPKRYSIYPQPYNEHSF